MRSFKLALLALLVATPCWAQLLLTGAGGGASGPVSIATNSLIFTSAASQFLSQTGKITINQQKGTYDFWYKGPATGVVQVLYNFWDGTNANRLTVSLNASGAVVFANLTGNVNTANLLTTASVTDGSWHNVTIAFDTTQATANNRVIIYIDGPVAALTTNTQPAQNTNFSNNFASAYTIGQRNNAQFLNGNLAQVYYIDGQQLTPSSFITGTPGVPKTYSGTYTGTFDFFLPFSNGTSTTTLGADSSGEGNNWTLNAMTVANQSTDHP